MTARPRPSITLIPFTANRRPGDEACAPGFGCSEHVDYVDSARPEGDGQACWLLYAVDGLPEGAAASVELSAWLRDDASAGERPAATLQRRPCLRALTRGEGGRPALAGAALAGGQRLVAELPCRELLNAGTAEDPEPLGFVHLFRRRVRVELALRVDGELVAADACEVEVFDAGRMGSLYRRLLDRLVADDIARERRAGLQPAHHPWYPVLTIGMTKAELYMRAIVQDLDDQTSHLPDPRWLLRVGLYLEWLTFLGIATALGEEGEALLSARERVWVATHPNFAPLRARLRIDSWRALCQARAVASPRSGPLSAGPVGLDNLLRKQRATLRFLHVHHEDLKTAIELAGPNRDDSQESWSRVFRDAERAVLRRARAAFPELERLPPRYREFALWHRRGDFRELGGAALPGWLTGLLGDQDGLFITACTRYRESLNEVARWAHGRGLMDYTGARCISRAVSLIEARVDDDPRRVQALQRGDGYPEEQAPDRSGCLRWRPRPGAGDRATLLAGAPVFAQLPDHVRGRLAASACPRELAAHERVVREGERGDSVFVVTVGEVEVSSRGPARRDRALARLGVGAVFGERAALTGAPRAPPFAPARGAVVLEIPSATLRSTLGEHPTVAIELAYLVAERRAPLEPESAGLVTRLGRWIRGDEVAAERSIG
ncbi:MAG: cyclic nucleotide-binding domain-containing protein [Myxococcales bacterium]|nr:cyclic nucleotide-binding domain-containing protein [Myxococcales bacterium]